LIIRLQNARELIREEQLRDPSVALAIDPIFLGTEDPGWEKVAQVSERVADMLDEMNRSDASKSEADITMANAVCDLLVLSQRDAGDRTVWHYGSIIKCRNYVQKRWWERKRQQAPDSTDPIWQTTENRLVGQVTRNALASLYWTACTLGEKDAPRPITQALFRDGGTRLQLWIIDFEPFFGRPELASYTVQYCIDHGIRTDEDVNALFKSLGTLATTTSFDAYRLVPQELLAAADKLRAELTAFSV